MILIETERFYLVLKNIYMLQNKLIIRLKLFQRCFYIIRGQKRNSFSLLSFSFEGKEKENSYRFQQKCLYGRI